MPDPHFTRNRKKIQAQGKGGILFWDFLGGTLVKTSPANVGDSRDLGSIPASGRSPGEGNGKSTPVFLPGKSHGQRSLAGYPPWGHKRARCDSAHYYSRKMHHF